MRLGELRFALVSVALRGERTYTAPCFDRRDRGRVRTERIDLDIRAVGVERIPFLTAYPELLDLRGVDQLHIIHIQRVIDIQTVIGAEVRIVGRREEHVAVRRHLIVHVKNRNTDTGPVAVGRARFQPCLRYLLRLYGGTALVAVQHLTHIGLLIDNIVRRLGTSTRFVQVFLTLRVSLPGIEEDMKILLVRRRTRTLDPYRYGVRTVVKTDTAL